MPNNSTIRLSVTGPAEEIGRLLRDHWRRKDTDGDTLAADEHLDFETILPMPAILHGTQSGSQADMGIFLLTGRTASHWSALSEDRAAKLSDAERAICLQEGQKCLDAERETGFRNWYDWSIAQWGTKWNSYDGRIEAVTPDSFNLWFHTAWSYPAPVIERLAELFPALTFKATAVDEGDGWALEAEYGPGDRRRYYELEPDEARRLLGCEHEPEETEGA